MSGLHYGDINIAYEAGTIFNDSTPGDMLLFTETDLQNIHIGTDAGNNAMLTVSNSNITIGGHIVPKSNVAFDLGAANMRFRDLYLSGNTIDLGGAKIQNDGGNNISIKDTDNNLKTLTVDKLTIGALSNATYSIQLATDSAAKPGTNTWTISSDERLKTNIELADLDTCYNIVHDLPLKRYTWKEEAYTLEQVKDRNKIGWIAQDVEGVFPKAVQQMPFKDIPDCRTLNADQIYATMYGAIQKVQLMVEQQHNDIKSLKEKLSNLEKI